ncbi:AMP-binding enzyme [Escherichia coli]
MAVVGVKDALKGQVAAAFVIPKESGQLEDRDAGALAREGDYGAGGQPDWQLWPPGALSVCLAIANAIRKNAAPHDPGDLRRTRSWKI